MSFEYNTTGIAKDTLQGSRLAAALSLSVPELTAIANGGPARHGVDSFTAVLALNVKGPAEKAARAQQAGQQPKPPTVKDQVVAAAQPAPTDTGIGSLNAGNVMTEQGMAAGGIVAFQGGGEIEDLSKELAELMRQRQTLGSRQVTFRGPAPTTDSAAILDAKITALQRRLQLAQNRSGFTAERNAMREQGITPAEFGTPPDLLQAQQAQQAPQGQQGTSGLGGTGGLDKVPSTRLPDQSQAYKNLAARLKEGYAGVDESTIASQMMGDPMARARFGYTTDELSNLYAPQAKLLEELPASREAARKEIENRYAGLDAIDTRRLNRAEEAFREAEKESGRDVGIGLAGLGFKIATARPNTGEMQSAIDTGLQYITSAKKDLKAARKDFTKSQDLMDEAKALREIGKEKEADEKYNDAMNKRMNFENAFTNAQITNETAVRSGIAQAAGRQASRQLEALNSEVGLSSKALESDATRAFREADIAKDYGVAKMYYGSRMAGQQLTNEDALKMAQTEVDKDKWASDFFIKNKRMPTSQDKETARLQIAKTLLAQYNTLQNPGAAVSGAAPQQTIDFSTGKPLI